MMISITNITIQRTDVVWLNAKQNEQQKLKASREIKIKNQATNQYLLCNNNQCYISPFDIKKDDCTYTVIKD